MCSLLTRVGFGSRRTGPVPPPPPVPGHRYRRSHEPAAATPPRGGPPCPRCASLLPPLWAGAAWRCLPDAGELEGIGLIRPDITGIGDFGLRRAVPSSCGAVAAR